MNDSEKKFASIYASAIQKEDDLSALLDCLKENPELLEMIIRNWFEDSLRSYAFCASQNVPESPDAQDTLLGLGEMVPNIFSKAARLAFSEFMLKSTQDMVFTDHQIEEIQKWLCKNHPEIHQDINAEESSNISYINSPGMKEREQKFLKKIRGMAGEE